MSGELLRLLAAGAARDAATLRVGDLVAWRGAWGADMERSARVEQINRTSKDDPKGERADSLDSIPWAQVTGRAVVVKPGQRQLGVWEPAAPAGPAAGWVVSGSNFAAIHRAREASERVARITANRPGRADLMECGGDAGPSPSQEAARVQRDMDEGEAWERDERHLAAAAQDLAQARALHARLEELLSRG